MEKLSISIEQKAKAYDEALKKAKDMLSYKEVKREDMEYLFPELKESEDERIRKELLEFLDELSKLGKNTNFDRWSKSDCADWICWLKKQGEQKLPIEKLPSEMKSIGESLGFTTQEECDRYNQMVTDIIMSDNDKVEPKFHEGEWIVWKDKCYKVNYNGCGYELVDQDGLSTSLEYGTIDENAHIWDVTTDAKDGDVLHSPNHRLIWIYKDIQYYHVCVNMNYVKENFSTDGFIVIPTDVCPATKDEQTILSVRIKESGYEWDAEKKELKKINSYCQENCKGFQEIGKCFADGECKAKREAEQEPTDEEMKTLLRTEYEKGRADAITEFQKAWSEEDESYLNTTIAYLKDAKEFKKTADNCINWLKSLRPQPKKEWSEEDEEFLRRAINATKDVYPMTAKWLKFLKDRVQPKQEWSKKDNQYLCGLIGLIEQSKAELPITLKGKAADNCIDWLKSLKKRYTWKPSDEQLEALKNAIQIKPFENPSDSLLWGLYEQLKTLKEY